MYKLLTVAPQVASAAGDTATATASLAKASALKAAVEAAGYWDNSTGLYRDKPGSSLYPTGRQLASRVFDLVATAERATQISAALAKRWTAIGALTPEKSSTSIHPFPGGMEVHAHFRANDGTAGVELIKREWGYMLNAPFGTGSTFWEGYTTAGTSDYNGSYMSASHGWSTGPTSALTYYVAGIRPSVGHRQGVPDRAATLRAVLGAGRFTTPDGPIEIAWTISAGKFRLTVTAPPGSLTDFIIRAPSGSRVVSNGSVVTSGGRNGGGGRAGHHRWSPRHRSELTMGSSGRTGQ